MNKNGKNKSDNKELKENKMDYPQTTKAFDRKRKVCGFLSDGKK